MDRNVHMASHCQSVLRHLIVSSAIDVWQMFARILIKSLSKEAYLVILLF